MKMHISGLGTQANVDKFNLAFNHVRTFIRDSKLFDMAEII